MIRSHSLGDRLASLRHVLGRESEVLVQSRLRARTRRSLSCRSTSPSAATQRSQPKVAAASTDTRARTRAAARSRGRPSSCSLKRSKQGMLTTRVGSRRASSRLGGVDADRHLRAGADQDQVGLAAPRRLAQRVGATADRVPGDPRRRRGSAGSGGSAPVRRAVRLLEGEDPGQRGLVGVRRPNGVDVGRGAQVASCSTG